MPKQEPQDEPFTLSTTLNLLYLWAAVQSACVLPFLRTGMGTRALGWLGPFAIVWMLCYAALRPCPQLVPYMAVWGFMCAIQKGFADRTQHSRYLGLPLLCRLPLVRSEQAGWLLETVAVAAAVIALFGGNPPVRDFAALSWGGLVVKLVIDQVLREKRLQDLRDAELSQHERMNAYRNFR